MTDPIEEAEEFLRYDQDDMRKAEAHIEALIAAARADRERLAAAESKLAAARELHASFPGSPLASEVIAGQAAKIEAMSAKLAAVTAERDEARHAAQVHCAGKINAWAERDRAESTLAQALAAMPTDNVIAHVKRALRATDELNRGTIAWLTRLDAFRASQGKATEPGECEAWDCDPADAVTCQTCQGTGIDWYDIGATNVPCPQCNGTGKRKGGDHG